MKNLNEIAREVLIEESRVTPHKLQMLMQLGSRAMRELNIDIVGSIKTVKLVPNNYRAISVPQDYFTYTKLGLCENGMIYNLGLNNDLCFPDTVNSCGQLQPESFSDSSGGTLFTDNFTDGGWGWYYWNFNTINENGEFIGKLYGQGSGNNPLGEYRFNEETREFILTPTLQGKEIVLEYISTGMNQENIVVPDEAVESVISFIKWKKSRGAERAQYKGEYEQNVMHLRLRKFSFTGEEFIAAVRKGYFLAAKQ